MPKGDFLEHYRHKPLRAIARRMRRIPTSSEDILWQALRNRRLQGLKFLRQHPIGASIVDFYCHEKRLAIEIDGPVHRQKEVAARDRARQELIEAYDIRFFRCTSTDVETNLQMVLKRILEATNE